MIKPVVSVIMAAHNERDYILESIHSILDQTLADLELIVVDDGSTDGTYDLLQTVADPRLRLIRNEQNLGLTASLNIALAEAQAPFIARLDAHDLSHPSRLARQVAHMEAHPELGLLGSSFHKIDHRGRLLGTFEVETRRDGIREKLIESNQFVHSTIMIRREAMQQLGGYREEFRYAQDYDLWLRLAEHWSVDNLIEPLVARRLVPTNITWGEAETQQVFSQLARRLARERRERGYEMTLVEEASQLILTNAVPDKIAKARSLLLYAELQISRRYYVEALPYLVRSVVAAPFWPEPWRLLTRITVEKLGLRRLDR